MESNGPGTSVDLLRAATRDGALAGILSFAAFAVLIAWNAHSQSATTLTVAGMAASASLASSVVSISAWMANKWQDGSNRLPIVIVVALTIGVLLLHLAVVNASGPSGCVIGPSGSEECISDEIYYVPAAHTLISGVQCAPAVAGCNLEHPFLGKAIVAAGIDAFGPGALGQRFGSILFGALSIPVAFLLVLVATGNRRFGYASATFLSLDTLFFSQSSAAFIDIPSLFFALCAFLVYFSGKRWWKLDGLTLAGLLLGVAALAKETAVFMLLTLVVYHSLFKQGEFSAWVKDLLKLTGATLVVFVVGLQVYDSLLASGAFPYFYQQVEYILTYGSALTGNSWTDPVLGTPITPLNWVTYYAPVAYLAISSHLSVAGPAGVPLFPSVGYYAAVNPILSWTMYIWMAVVLILALNLLKSKPSWSNFVKDDRFLFFLAIWFASVFLPYLALWLFGRDTYPYYLVIATPAMSAGTGYLITRDWFDRRVSWLLVGVAVLGFVYYFPVKSFMPDWLRLLFPR